jgi:hypothetical protein
MADLISLTTSNAADKMRRDFTKPNSSQGASSSFRSHDLAEIIYQQLARHSNVSERGDHG